MVNIILLLCMRFFLSDNDVDIFWVDFVVDEVIVLVDVVVVVMEVDNVVMDVILIRLRFY